VPEKIALKRFGSISEKIQRNIFCTTVTSFFRLIDINLDTSANSFVYVAKDSSLIKNNQFLTNLLKGVAISPIAALFFSQYDHIGCSKKMKGNLSSRSRLCHVLVCGFNFFASG